MFFVEQRLSIHTSRIGGNSKGNVEIWRPPIFPSVDHHILAEKKEQQHKKNSVRTINLSFLFPYSLHPLWITGDLCNPTQLKLENEFCFSCNVSCPLIYTVYFGIIIREIWRFEHSFCTLRSEKQNKEAT